ncbi:sensor histidine kinase regulating citrate/malate metabolism [Pseudokineococcus lusitanus]|uniref:histidine kinase n=2 Tax=Pseudokineococcus lusitanus TaxID=763993 RepID=A0A3N1HR91_9ACTN|nr:sensor histidine kinase regulating citrate/malate metabolism [Pseudokineococcus lusitanus]
MWWQVALVVALVVVAAVLATVDVRADARDGAGERAEAVAVSVADSPEVREVAVDADLDVAARSARLQPFVERVRRDTGTSFVVVMATDGTRWTHPDRGQIGRTYIGSRDAALAGGRVVETYTGTLGPSVRAVVPVVEGGDVVALVATGISVTSVGEDAADGLRLVLLAGAGVLALALGGSYLVARRARRLTLGLAGPELARMVTYYDAVLRSVREGLLLVDADGRVQLLNEEARALLDLPDDVVGRPVDDLGLPPGLVRLLRGDDDVADEVVLTASRVLVASVRDARAPSGAGAAPAHDAGRVMTLRDRTDLLALSDELETTRSLAEALRSQAHEQANRLHTVVQLVEMGRSREAVELAVDELAAAQALTDQVVGAVAEPVVAALLLGASARAAERGVDVVVAGQSRLDEGALDRTGTPVRDVLTVLGNLTDNAVDAAAAARDAAGGGDALVEVVLRADDDGVVVEVSDSGAGLAPEDAERAFRRGWSTKGDGGRLHGRGLGLALVGQAVDRLGGRIDVSRSDLGGACFAVRLPAGPGPSGAGRADAVVGAP